MQPVPSEKGREEIEEEVYFTKEEPESKPTPVASKLAIDPLEEFMKEVNTSLSSERDKTSSAPVNALLYHPFYRRRKNLMLLNNIFKNLLTNQG